MADIFPTQYVHQRAFTLIELSIVLVIIALVAAGVMMGNEMITQAKYRALQSQIEQMTSAVNTFRTKYNCLPGDCATATQFFGSLSACPGEANTYGTTNTCNGDGNGYIGALYNVATPDWRESARFWQHLGNANLIAGQYAGSTVGGVYVVGQSNPVSALGGQTNLRMAQMDHPANPTYSGSLWPMKYGNSFHLLANTSWFWGGGSTAFLPAQMQIYDTKFDDGLPGTGKIVTPRRLVGFTAPCPSTDDATTAVYDLTNTTNIICIPIWRDMF